MLDSHGRNIDYLRVSLTDRCNLRCIYCMPEEGVDKKMHDDILRFEEVLKVVKVSSTLGIRKIRYTGGEPLILKGIEKLIYETSQIRQIEDISMTTNGMLLYDAADELKRAGLRRVNISLDTLNEEKFRMITRGGSLKKVLDAVDKCIKIGLSPVKLNIVLIRGINDNETKDFMNLTKDMPLHIRFIELMPIGEGTKLYKYGAMSAEEVINAHPDLIPVNVEKSSTARVYKLKDAKGTIGFISPLSCKFCGDCNRIRLTASGSIKPCLHSENEISIKEYLNNEIMLASVLKNTIFNKPGEHHLDTDNESKSKRAMYQIGG
jgi:cyclic pyranopterin phosphate synthase